MSSIHTTRFGEIAIDENRVIRFPEGILGFPLQKDFIILEHHPDSPFFWLQSIGSPELAFVLTDPLLTKSDYLDDLQALEKSLANSGDGDNTLIFSIVTIRPGVQKKMTVNLLGPIVIDIHHRIGKQVILTHSGYSHQHPLVLQN
jgi:flagellar assembly factor FliW